MSGDAEPPLQYEMSASPVSRRQFRWLFAVVIVNLLVTIQGTYWPNASAWVTTRWAKYQETRQARAAERQAMTWAQPAATVVWDEDPDTAAKLLAAPGYKRVQVEGLDRHPKLANFPPFAAAISPAFVDEVWAGLSQYRHPFPRVGGRRSVETDEHALVFVHERKTSTGESHLVFVYVEGKMKLRDDGGGGGGGFAFREPPPDPQGAAQPGDSGSAGKALSLVAITTLPGGGEQPIKLVPQGGTVLLINPEVQSQRLKIPWTWAPSAGGQPEQFNVKSPEVFRFYAGQADPNDPSRFTIGYTLNGNPGTISGQLKNNGSVELKPDAGTMVGQRWYPLQK